MVSAAKCRSHMAAGRTPAAGVSAGYQNVAMKALVGGEYRYKFVRAGSIITRSTVPTANGPLGFGKAVSRWLAKVR